MKKFVILILIFGLNLGHAQDFNGFPNIQSLFPYFPGIWGPQNPTEEICEEEEESLIAVQKTDLPRNPKASYCKRSMDIVDTIVLHHSETDSMATVESINDFHLNRGTADDPWYMIAYHYAIHAPYKGSKKPEPVVFQGRPKEYVGAHAGSDAFETLTPEQKKKLEETEMLCGKDGGEFKPNPDVIINGTKTKANNTSIGIVVIGNYSPFSRSNPNGYSSRNPRNPTDETIDMVARLSCQLQKKYPNITRIRWHNFYKATSCPGNIKNHVDKIRTKAGSYGCKFN